MQEEIQSQLYDIFLQFLCMFYELLLFQTRTTNLQKEDY